MMIRGAVIAVWCVVAGLTVWHFLPEPVPKPHDTEAAVSTKPAILQGSLSEAFRVPDDEDIFALEQRDWDQFERKTYAVKPGDSLTRILESLNLSPQGMAPWMADEVSECRPELLKQGDVLDIDVLRATNEVVRIRLRSEAGGLRLLLKQGDAWVCRNQTPVTFTLTQAIVGTISDNLYNSCVREGMPSELIMDLADLFAYDVDFTSDLRAGDRFAVVYELTVGDGRLVKAGPIRAAQMTVSGQTYHAYFYEFPDGFSDYFDEEGKSLRKMFLKAPLSYRRISSTFTYRRFHPVLRIFRPHLGIDYAAPAGTPISALGDGKVTRLGWNGGFGRYVEIQHDGVYKTSYGHLSRYAEGLKVGSRVQQGDVIGYVGSSGLATGPHLDFRFYQDGRPVDFLKTSFPNARSIPKSLMADFQKKQRELASRLSVPTVAAHGSSRPVHP